MRQALFTAVLVVLVLLASPIAAALASDGEDPPFLLTSTAEVVASASTVYYPRPTVILFTDANSHAPLTAAARESVRQLRRDIPPAVARVHEFQISPSDVAAAQLMTVLLPATRLPCLALFGSSFVRGVVLPGTIISAGPVAMSMLFPGSLANSTAMRQWLLAELPARYSDPVTYHMMPALHLIVQPTAVAVIVKTLERDVQVTGTRAALPEFVVFAYAHLTASGSQEFVAALSSIAAQAGERLLVVVTESAALAKALFPTKDDAELPAWHQLAAVSLSAMQAAIVTPASDAAREVYPYELSLEALRTVPMAARLAVDDSDDASLLHRTSRALTALLQQLHIPLPLTPVPLSQAELPEVLPGVAAPRSERAADVLRAWSRTLSQHMTGTGVGKGPLRQLTSTAELQHDLRSEYTAINVIFFLRESDRLLFGGYRKLAEDFARRVSWQSLVGYKTLDKQTKLWRPPFTINAFWVDAERYTSLARQLNVASVPAVTVLVPLTNQGDGSQPDPPLSDLGSRLVGVHHITVHDLTVVDTTTSPVPQNAKEAAPMFPTDVHQLLRFFASPQFASRVAFNMMSPPISSLVMDDASRGSGSAATQPSSTPALDATNTRLSWHYYGSTDPSGEYLRGVILGVTPLPPFDAAEYRDAAEMEGMSRAVQEADAGPADDASRKQKEAQKEKLRGELEARRKAKEARMAEKARKDAEAREAAAKKLKEEVQTTLNSDSEQDVDLLDGRVSVQRPVVADATSESPDLLTRFRYWQAQAKRMAPKYVRVIEGKFLRFQPTLEHTE